MKLGFVLTNYRAKLQVEKVILKKEIKNVHWYNLFKNRKLKRRLKDIEDMILYITNHIKYLESNNKDFLNRIVSDTFISKKQMKLEELKVFINNL